jgi:hypothetical protein
VGSPLPGERQKRAMLRFVGVRPGLHSLLMSYFSRPACGARAAPRSRRTHFRVLTDRRPNATIAAEPAGQTINRIFERHRMSTCSMWPVSISVRRGRAERRWGAVLGSYCRWGLGAAVPTVRDCGSRSHMRRVSLRRCGRNLRLYRVARSNHGKAVGICHCGVPEAPG